MKRKVLWIGSIVVVLMAAVFLIWRANSLRLALSGAGLCADAITEIVELDADSNGEVFQILKTTSETGEIALVRVVKNTLGFWRVETINTIRREEQMDYVSIAWVKGAGARRFTHLENAEFENEWHYVYCGEDAVKKIEFAAGELPHNVTVNIQQAGEFYLIHMITFADPEELGGFNIRTLLEKNGFVGS